MLEVAQLTAGYDGTAIIDLPALSLAAGEHCLILGRSGSGKTTLLYALAGLLRPLGGSIHIDGNATTMLSATALDAFRGTHIGIIYQTLHMVSALSVLENLLLASYAAGQPQDTRRAETLLARLELFETRHRKPDALSQGQRQRAAIARAAMNNPKLILGDEPTSALDDDTCTAVMQLLLETAETSGATLIVATHDARIAPYFQRTVVLGGAE